MSEISDEQVIKQIGGNLRRLRKLYGLSQHQLGELLGVTFQQVQKYENGTNRISAAALWRLADALQIEADQFFYGLEACQDRAAPDLQKLIEGYRKLPPRARPALLACLQALTGEG